MFPKFGLHILIISLIIDLDRIKILFKLLLSFLFIFEFFKCEHFSLKSFQSDVLWRPRRRQSTGISWMSLHVCDVHAREDINNVKPRRVLLVLVNL